jgi:type IV pilus assembly protein PilO
MADVRDTRQKLKIAITALAIVDLVAAALWISPVVGSERSRREHLDQLWKELQIKTREIEPLRDIDKKISTARQQIDDFYQSRLPGQDSVVSEELGKIAGQSGVKIGQIKYKWEDPQSVGLRQVHIEADFTGGYLQLVRFINSLERDKLFFIVDSVQLASGEQGSQVRLQLTLETYLKASA